MPEWASTPQFWLSMVLAAAGCSGLVLAGKGRWYGWALGLAIQPVWALFGIVSGAYGLIITSAAYAWVYWANLARWRKEVKRRGTDQVRDRAGAA